MKVSARSVNSIKAFRAHYHRLSIWSWPGVMGRKRRTKAVRARILRWRPRIERIEIGIAGLAKGSPGFDRALDDLIAMLSDEELESLTAGEPG